MSEKNVILNNFQHLKCIGVGVPCNFTDTYVVHGKPYLQWHMLWPMSYVGRYFVNDVYGRCYAKCGRWNTTVADVLAT